MESSKIRLEENKMSKYIKLTEAKIREVLAETEKKLRAAKMLDGTVSINCTAPDMKDARANIIFAPIAYAKMLSLITNFDSEVAWHGVVERDGLNFHITDIIVYPQVVTGATVTTDQEEYETWLMELEDEQFNYLRMQGHSHVNMSVSPSGVDLTHQEAILEQLSEEDYYIFMIVNKRMEMFISIFDLAGNLKFETTDVDLFIGSTGFSADEFISEARKQVVKRSSMTSSYGGFSGYNRHTYEYDDAEDFDWRDYYQTYLHGSEDTTTRKTKSTKKSGKKK